MASGKEIKAGRAFVEVFMKDKLSGGLKNLQRRTEQLGASFLKMGGVIAGVGGSIVGSFLGATKSFMSMGDELDKMSLRTGVAVESLSALGFAAQQNGSDLATLEKGIKTMQKSLLDADLGLSTATDALDRLGVSAEQLRAMSPEEQFKTLADAVAGIEDPGDKAALAMKFLGRAGQSLVPLLSGGRRGIEELTDEAQRLGIVMSTEQATAAAQMTDAWNRIKQQLLAVTTQIGSGLAPLLLDVAQRLGSVASGVIDWVKSNKQLVTTIFKLASVVTFTGGAVLALGAALKLAAMAQAAVLALSGPKGWVLLAVGVAAATAATVALNANLRESERAAGSAASGYRDAADAAEEFAQGAGGGDAELKAMVGTIKTFTDRLRELKSLEDTGLAILPVLEAREGENFQGKFLDQLKEFREASRAAQRPVDELREALSELQAAAADGLLPAGVAGEVGRMLEDAIGKKSGIADALKAGRAELDLMLDRVSEIDLKVGQFLEQGALPQQAAELRELLEKIEATKQREQYDRAQELAKEQQESQLDSLAESIISQTRTPEEAFADKLRELESVRDRIGEDTFARAEQQAREEMDRRLAAGRGAADQFASAKTAPPETLEKGSIEAARKAFENKQQQLFVQQLAEQKELNDKVDDLPEAIAAAMGGLFATV